MTEQLERDLAAMFTQRAERLDIRPPLPAARLRAVRLQAGLSAAVVLAVVAGMVVAGTRLAGGPAGGGDVAGASAKDRVQAAFEATYAGHWRAVTVEHDPGQRPQVATTVAEYDSTAGTARQEAGGFLGAMAVGGLAYLPVTAGEWNLPPKVRWQSVDLAKEPGSHLATFFVTPLSNAMVVNQGGRSVVRGWTQTGPASYTATLSAGPSSEALLLTLSPEGAIRRLETRQRVQLPEPSGATGTLVTVTTFTRLPGHLTLAAPGAGTVITDKQYQDYFRAFAQSHSGGNCMATPTPTPSVSETTSSNGSTTSVGTATATVCQAHAVRIGPGTPGPGSPSASPR